ncbi:MAG: IS6 family transposase, partial [Candidatus Aenigmarchaeota archaeon]|nr:IS6 family transposase [Candidatus Aenigmarchaeota archaeon]
MKVLNKDFDQNTCYSKSSILKRLFGIEISHVAVLKWVRKYARCVEKFTSMKRPKLSGKWSVDEKFVKVKGKKGYIWLVKDKKRGFVIMYVLSDNREAKNAGKLFRRAKKVGNPKSINRDGYAGYKNKIAKHFPD